ncbi:MAG: hypothetical protein IMZ67_09365 [Acidobacteria bacterium]|nr:hypothetical protein [Acidobacteriota bacterium]
MPETTEFERDIRLLEAELRRLEVEYNTFFAGQLPRPPWETRGRVDALIRRYDRAHIQSFADRFRFSTLRARYTVFADLWDRGLRAKEEGRPGPFFKPREADRKVADTSRPEDRILHVTTVVDPIKDIRKLEELYERLVEAGREVGQEAFPFHKFVQLVRSQVSRLQREGSREIAFRVALREGHVSFTARGLKGI